MWNPFRFRGQEIKELEKTEKTEETGKPDFEQLGITGSSRMFSFIGREEVYNPDRIPLRTYEAMKLDPQIQAGLSVIKLYVKFVSWFIKAELEEIKIFVEENLRQWWNEFFDPLLTALEFGFSVFEKRWVIGDDKMIHYKHPLPLDPTTITVREEESKLVGITQRFGSKEIKIPRDKIFIYSHNKGEQFGNLYGRSKLKAAYPFWYASRYAYEYVNQFYGKYASGILKGFAPPGKTPKYNKKGEVVEEQDNIEHMNELLETLRSASSVALPWTGPDKRFDFEIVEAKRTGADPLKYINHLDVKKIRALFVPDLIFTHTEERGSFALAKEHKKTFLRSIDALIMEIKSQIDMYLLPQLVFYNFGNRKATWEFEPPSKEARELLEKVYLAMVTGELLRPPVDEISKRLGLPVIPSGAEAASEDIPELSRTEAKEKQKTWLLKRVGEIFSSQNPKQSLEEWKTSKRPIAYVELMEKVHRRELNSLLLRNPDRLATVLNIKMTSVPELRDNINTHAKTLAEKENIELLMRTYSVTKEFLGLKKEKALERIRVELSK